VVIFNAISNVFERQKYSSKYIGKFCFKDLTDVGKHTDGQVFRSLRTCNRCGRRAQY